MNVLFVEPPAARRVGGIETALQGLASALPAADVHVSRRTEIDRSQVAAADVVHFHGLWEWTHHRVRRWCGEVGRPFVVSPHGMLEDWAFRHRGWKKRPYFHCVERPSLQRANVILATSQLEAAPLQRWFDPAKIAVLPLGGQLPPPEAPAYDAARSRLQFATDEFVILFLSRCHAKKGLHVLVEATALAARDSRRKIHLVIVGTGIPDYVEPLSAATRRWTGPLRCTWTGAVWGAEKWTYLAAADLFCLPSFSENFGLAILEALFAGTPVLTTPATPWPALRGSLPISFTSPSVSELSAALRERIAQPKISGIERATTAANAQAAFDWASIAPRYARLYRQLAGSA